MRPSWLAQLLQWPVSQPPASAPMAGLPGRACPLPPPRRSGPPAAASGAAEHDDHVPSALLSLLAMPEAW